MKKLIIETTDWTDDRTSSNYIIDSKYKSDETIIKSVKSMVVDGTDNCVICDVEIYNVTDEYEVDEYMTEKIHNFVVREKFKREFILDLANKFTMYKDSSTESIFIQSECGQDFYINFHDNETIQMIDEESNVCDTIKIYRRVDDAVNEVLVILDFHSEYDVWLS